MHIVGKYKDLYVREPVIAKVRAGGEFRVIVVNENGTVDQDTGWFSNLITDTGLIHFSGSNGTWYYYCHLGSDNTAPAVTDSTLGSWLGRHSSQQASVQGPTATTPDYEFYTTAGWTFNAGVCTGTIRELGISVGTTNTNMSIRTLVSPEVTKSSTQILYVYYRFTVWPTLTDNTGVVNIGGDDYDYTLRPCGLGSAHTAYATFGLSSTLSHHDTYANGIGTITGSPTGGDGLNAESVSLQSRGSGYYESKITWGLSVGNYGGGIRSTRHLNNFNNLSSRGWQIEYSRVSDSAAIPKDNTMKFYVTIRMTWDRV